VLLLERIARLYDTQPPEGTIRRGPRAGVEPEPGGTVRPYNTPPGLTAGAARGAVLQIEGGQI